MRIFLFLVLAISFSIGSFAQGLPDSTVIAIRISRNDSLRLRSYMEAYTYFRERNRDSAFYYNHLCLQIARKNSESLMEAVCQVRNSLQLTAIGHYAESLSILLEVLQITERLDSKESTWLVRPELSFQKNRLSVLSDIHYQIAILMHQTLNYEESKFHFRELRRLALEIEENSDRIIDADIGLVYNHLDENKIDSAYYLITRIEKFAQQAGKKYNKPFIGLHIGYTLFATGDLDARSNTS